MDCRNKLSGRSNSARRTQSKSAFFRAVSICCGLIMNKRNIRKRILIMILKIRYDFFLA